MSFESGKKLGLAASLIAVVVPVVAVITVVVFLVSLFLNALSGNGVLSPLAGFIILIIVLVIVSFVGIILFIVAMHHLAEYYSDPTIFRNVLYGFLTNVVGAIVAIVIYAVAIVSSLRNISSPGAQSVAFITPFQTLQTSLPGALTQIFTGYVVSLVVSLVLAIVSAVFYMRAFNKLGEKSGVYNFKTAGILYLLGGALAIVGIGALLIWIAWIYALMGFHSLKPKTSETSLLPSATPQFAPNPVQKRYCPHCGTENNPDSFYCKWCGKRLQ